MSPVYPKTYTLQALYTEVLPAGGRRLVEVGRRVCRNGREVPVLGFFLWEVSGFFM